MHEFPSGEYAHSEIMAGDVMVRTLAKQADAVWPREQWWFERLDSTAYPNVLDVGCGPGEITLRLARDLGFSSITGMDLEPRIIDIANQRARDVDNVSFTVGDATALPFEDNRFDLAVNRHMLQVVPSPEEVIREMARVVRPGGLLYFLVEDYGMINGAPVVPDLFWHRIQPGLQKRASDLFVGRKCYGLLKSLGFEEIGCHYASPDTINTPAEVWEGIFRFWSEGYAAFISEACDLPVEEAKAHFQAYIDDVHHPEGYVVWHLPVFTVRNPT